MLDWTEWSRSDTVIFLFKQKTGFEMRISDGSSDVCSSDLFLRHQARAFQGLRDVAIIEHAQDEGRDPGRLAMGGAGGQPLEGAVGDIADAAGGDDQVDLGQFLRGQRRDVLVLQELGGEPGREKVVDHVSIYAGA